MTRRPFAATDFMESMTARAWKESNPEVGSSRNNTAGSEISCAAMFALFLSPPEIPRCFSSPIMVSLVFPKPSSSITSDTSAFLASNVTVSGK